MQVPEEVRVGDNEQSTTTHTTGTTAVLSHHTYYCTNTLQSMLVSHDRMKAAQTPQKNISCTTLAAPTAMHSHGLGGRLLGFGFVRQNVCSHTSYTR